MAGVEEEKLRSDELSLFGVSVVVDARVSDEETRLEEGEGGKLEERDDEE